MRALGLESELGTDHTWGGGGQDIGYISVI